VNRSWVRVVGRLALTFGAVYGGFLLLLNPWRYTEADVVTGVLNALGVDRVRGGYGNQILVMPSSNHPFLASISPSCSALAAVLAFGAIALFLVRGEPRRRFVAFLGAAGLVLVCNMVRIAMSIWVGLVTSEHGLVVFHDWVGTAFGLLYVLGGFTLFLFLLLPSNKQLLKEATSGQ
jgi:exosortase/archaeosortase family protein